MKYANEDFLASITDNHSSSTVVNLAYQAELKSDFDNGEVHCTDPWAYATKFKTYEDDNPSYNMAMNGESSIEYQLVIVKEIRQLIKQNTWCSIPRSSVPNNKAIIHGTWAFKIKRLPDGTMSKHKIRYCVPGDKKVEEIDEFDTYAPIVQ